VEGGCRCIGPGAFEELASDVSFDLVHHPSQLRGRGRSGAEALVRPHLLMEQTAEDPCLLVAVREEGLGDQGRSEALPDPGGSTAGHRGRASAGVS